MHSSSDIPDKEPTSFICGDTVKWNRKDLSSHYPADAWTLTYNFRGPTIYDVTAAANGRDFAITIPATDTGDNDPNTAKFLKGRYQLFGRVTKISDATQVFSVYSGNVDACENPEDIEAGRDMRTEAKKILDAHMTVYARGAESRTKSYSLSAVGRSFVYHSFEELIAAIDYWKGIVAQEENPTGVGRNVFIRFTRPTRK